MFCHLLVLLVLFPFVSVAISFTIPESAPVGHIVGYVEGKPQLSTESKYLVVFPDRMTEKIFSVDDKSGEITTLILLDYEKHRKFQILAVPLIGGDGNQIQIDVEDENNHQPSFPSEKVVIEISEYARIGAEYRLPIALDQDGPQYNVQKYRIAQGNVNNVFKITTRRINEVLLADLVVNGQLDREYRDKYELIVEAIDGGKPEQTARLRVQIVILDANDNVPIFSKPRYSISLPSSTPIGANVLTVEATDGDLGENSRINYRLQRTKSSSLSFFSLSPKGVLSTTTHLLPGAVHDLVVVAADHGQPSLETTAFVSITVQGTAVDEPALDIFWLTDTSTAHLLENITLGSIVARVSLNEKFRGSTLIMSGCPALCLQQSDSGHIYLVMVCGIFDRETMEEYPLKFVLNRDGEVVLEHPVLLTIGDVNDNAPFWNNLNIHIILNRTENDHPPILSAVDLDRGANGRIRYSILDTDLLSIDAETGRLIVLKELDCSMGSELRFRIKAEDQGTPQLASELQVIAELIDSAGQPPQFEKPLYEVMVKEDVEKGTCLLKVIANNSRCGGATRIKYQWSDQLRGKFFSLDSTTGTICLDGQLDFEKATTHRISVQAIDSNGLSSFCLVWIRVLDVNDHAPVFHPTDYNISIREGDPPTEAILAVSATDADQGSYGEVSYFISDASSPFRVDSHSGEVFLSRQLPLGKLKLIVQVKDGLGLTADHPAVIHVTVISSDSPSPSFTRSKYVFQTSEDILPGISIGNVQAFGNGKIRYSIYSGDTFNQFAIHPENGRITVTRYLDADSNDKVLLNIQADLEDGGSNHTQVIVEIEDHNDNPPIFPVDIVEITIREDQPPLEPFYVVSADDKDGKKNGEVSYTLLSSQPPCPLILQPHTGQLHLTEKLDFEAISSYRIRIKATDHGVPPKNANITILLHVSDVNDNFPTFLDQEYKAQIVENSPSMTPVIQVTAQDRDSGEAGKIHYRITNGSEFFGIDEKSGHIYTTTELDREEKERFNLTIVAEDRGNPPLSSSVHVSVKILDVNDNPPSCSSIQTLIVPSDSDTHAPFGSVIAFDPDASENGTVVYRLQQTHPLFLLTANGDVILRRLLTDSDLIDYRLSIIAVDQGNPKKSAVCHVPIKVTTGVSQIKLEEPFERTIRIPQDCLSDCKIRRINATGVTKWQLQSSELSSHFYVSNSWLYLISPPTILPPWTLTLILSDKDGRQKHIQVKLLPPISKNLKASIFLPSTLPIGTKIALIGEQTADYFFSMINKSDIFELDPLSGSIYLNGRLRDHSNENIHLYFEKIAVNSQDSEEIEMEFEVAPTAISRPIFKENVLNVLVAEDTAIDSVIATVTVLASDSNSSIIYRLLSGPGFFVLDEFSGDIVLKRQLDAYEDREFNLAIEAVVVGGANATILVRIEIQDVNNNRPQIRSEPLIHLFPDSSSPIHTVVATDRDLGANGQVTYELIKNPEGNYKINSKTGEISLEKIPLSEESIVVRATDQGNPLQLFIDQKIDVRLMSTSHRWHFFSSPEFRFNSSDSAQVGEFIGQVTGKGSARLRAIALPSDFNFDEMTGEIKVIKKVKAGLYSFTVIASSSSGEMDWTIVWLKITSLTEEILRISSSSCGSVTVPENRNFSALKRIITTGGAGDKVKFRIQGHQSLFFINSTSGEIYSSQLDREQKSEHLLVIIAEEGGRNDSCTVRVTVADENDNSPQFSMTTPQLIVLKDSAQVGEILYKLQVMDLDTGNNGKVVYELVDDPSEILDLNPESGALVFRRDISFFQKEWMIRVKARDMALVSRSSDRLIRIKDERSSIRKTETKPVFLRAQYVSTVEEGKERGLPVAKVAASARDTRITYSIVEGNVDNAFEIDGDGNVRTAQELDYEIRSEYFLKIIATGPFSDEITTSLQVKVNNINDNPPSFPKNKNRKILESVPAGSYITTFTANDADMTDILEYSLLTEEKKFSIDPFTGVIHSLVPLDYEENKEIVIKAAVTDGKHRIEGGFTIILVDVNDNPPEFSKSFFDLSISPAAQIDDVIIKLTASDRDSGDNGKLSYSLEGYEEIFQMSPDGTLSLITPVSVGLEYMTTIIATDHGSPRLYKAVPVRITVINKDKKEGLTFTKPLYEFLIQEDAPLHIPIGNISLSQEPQWYRIISQEEAKIFRIDRFGQIYAISPLDREKQDVHQFEVEVGVESPYENTATVVKIKLGDVNDNEPIVENKRIRLTIRDGLKNGDILYRLSATDSDSGDNGQVIYGILSGNDYQIITIAPESGAIMFNEWNEEVLSQYRNGSWVTVIEVSDKGHPRRSTLIYLDVSISFSSWSATAPFFVQSQYIAHVEEIVMKDSVIFTAKAVNRAGLPISGLVYELKDVDGTFFINSSSGAIRLRSSLDYETRPLYKMSLSASDSRGRSAVVAFEVRVLPIDEYPPVFSKPRYTFQVPINSAVGSTIGVIRAVDADAGPHGEVKYGIEGNYRLVAIDEKNGEITLRRPLTNRQNLTIEQLTIIAYSTTSQRSRATVYLEIGPFFNSLSPMGTKMIKLAFFSLIGVFSALVFVIVICVCCKRRKELKQVENNPKKQVFSITQGHPPRMSDARRMSPAYEIHPLTRDLQAKANSMTSSTSTQSGLRSAMSNRDHISTRSQPDSGIDPDTISQTSSVTEYLVSLGVNPNPIPPKPRHRRRETVDSHLNDLIYAKVEDVCGPGPLDVSKRMDYLDQQPVIIQSTSTPTFQPMSEIFAEINRLKEEEKLQKAREYVQIEI